jgi:hypothetical protein
LDKVRPGWKVVLGKEHAQRYTHAAVEAQGLHVLGCVSRGGQFGALARAADGQYVQVNGDHVTALSQAQIGRAIRLATAAPDGGKGMQRRAPPSSERSSAPVVVVKRRRVIVRPDDEHPSSR